MIAIILALTGRLHWISASIPLLIIGFKYIGRLFLRLWPFVRIYQQQSARFTHDSDGEKKNEDRSTPQSGRGQMSVQEAYQILGINERSSRQEILQAHRNLIRKLHPDQGGSDYLASKINQAKDVLLG